MGRHPVYVITAPRLVRQVLSTQADSFAHGRIYDRARVLFGNGLATSEGPHHHKQRRLIQSAYAAAADADLQAHVAALEAPVRDLTGRLQIAEQDAAAAVLAGGTDWDVTAICSEIRDFRQAALAEFTAVHEDRTDLRDLMNTQFSEVHNGFAEIQGELAAAASGQSRISPC